MYTAQSVQSKRKQNSSGHFNENKGWNLYTIVIIVNIGHTENIWNNQFSLNGHTIVQLSTVSL